mgnify:FL=1
MKLGKTFFLIICCFFTTVATSAQISKEIMKVLENTSENIRKCGNVKATFIATQLKHKQSQGSTKGMICISGNKLHIDGGATKIWYDGKTQWSYSSSTKEVNVSTPSKSEAAKINPYSFIYLYKQGYNAAMSEATVRGKSCYDVHLSSNARKDMKYVYLTIEKATMLPICVRMSPNGNDWTRISIYDVYKKQKFSASTFKFSAKDFPNTEVIDLR